MLGEDPDSIMRISGKTGEGVEEVLELLVERVPPPSGDLDAPPRALIFDSEFDQYRGVIAYIRVVDGTFTKGEAITAMAAGVDADIDDIGFFSPTMVSTDELHAGEVGYLITGIKDVTKLRVGDTLTTRRGSATEALSGYQDVKPMVYCGLFPIDGEDYPDLRDALEKLTLNDAALDWEPETSDALGFGFRVGFLGLLHMDIVRERLEREYNLNLMATMPSVRFEVELTDGTVSEVHSPSAFPDPSKVAEVREPYVRGTLLSPKEFVGPIMELCQEKRGEHQGMTYLSADRVQLTYDLPLSEIVLDFFDQLKSRTKGYASLDYEVLGMRPSNLVKLDVLLAGEAVDALSMLVHRDKAYEIGRDAGREAAREDPAPAVRRPDPGGDRVAHRGARDGQRLPQGRHRQVLRRRHLAQAQAARAPEGRQEAHEAGRPRRGARRRRSSRCSSWVTRTPTGPRSSQRASSLSASRWTDIARPFGGEPVGLVGVAFDDAGLEQLLQPLGKDRCGDVVAGHAQAPERQRTVAQLPHDPQDPATAEEGEEVVDRVGGHGGLALRKSNRYGSEIESCHASSPAQPHIPTSSPTRCDG